MSAPRPLRPAPTSLTREQISMTDHGSIPDSEDGYDDQEIEIEQDEEPFPPPGLKEISSLASWTVSTAKPGNGVAALRSPDMNQFWQSDGPQPHLLSIHFFKLVEIVLIRIYLDATNDESYTPTKIQFLAGMGAHDVQEFAEMSFDSPTGWIDVDFSSVGPECVLRAMLLQIRILENFQNGKDTHMRGVQIFAKDEVKKKRLDKMEFSDWMEPDLR